MLALISYEPGRRGVLQRLKRRRPKLTYGVCAGMTVMCGVVSTRREAEVLRNEIKKRADCVCFSENFPFSEIFAAIPEAENKPLAPALIIKLANMLSNKEGTAYYSGGTGNAALLETLCLKNRYVLAETPDFITVNRLREVSGVSIIVNPEKKHIIRANTAFFTKAPGREIELSRTCLAVADCDSSLVNVRGVLRVTGLEIESGTATPDGFPRQTLLLEAVRRGTLNSDNLRIGRILTNM